MHDYTGGHTLWMLLVAALVVVPFWRISQRLGYPGWLSLLVLAPLVNIGYLYFLAFVPASGVDGGPGHARQEK